MLIISNKACVTYIFKSAELNLGYMNFEITSSFRRLQNNQQTDKNVNKQFSTEAIILAFDDNLIPFIVLTMLLKDCR